MPLWQSILKKPESGIRITVKCPAPSPVISNRVLALFPIRQEISSPNHFVQLHPKICCLRHRQIGNNTPWFRDPTRIFTSWMLAFRKKANNPRAQCRHGRQRCVGPLPSAGAPFPPVCVVHGVSEHNSKARIIWTELLCCVQLGIGDLLRQTVDLLQSVQCVRLCPADKNLSTQ